MRIIFAIIVALISSPLLAAEPARYEFTSIHMGTQWKIVLYANERDVAEKASKAAFARVTELDLVMSDYNTKSELMLACKANDAKPGEPIKISKDLMTVLIHSQTIAADSEGTFDVTVGPVVQLWRVARKTKQLLDAKELATAKELVGYQMVTLDEKAGTMTLKKAGMRLDFGGIGKGFAADEAMEVLKKQGITSALIAASGDITVSDAPPGKTAWTVDIAAIGKDRPARRLNLVNASVSTSGDLFQYVEIKGVRYSHVIDPRTGIGLTGRRSATVIASKGWLADSLTKAASVMEPDKALKVMEKHKAAMYVVSKADDDAKEVVVESKSFVDYVAK